MGRSVALPARCPACQTAWREYDEIQVIPRPMMIRRGEKSGVLGVYDHPQYREEDEDVVHYPHCCGQYFNPEDNPHLYDLLCQEVEEQKTKELKEEVREELQEKMGRILGAATQGQVLPNMCQRCWDELEDPEPTMCIFCKHRKCVWEKFLGEGVTHYWCQACGKAWDQDEEEIVQGAA